MLNRQRLGVKGCIDVIVRTLEQPAFEATPESLQILEAKSIEARIYSALKRNDVTNRPSPYFEVKLRPGTGEVLLAGVVPDDEYRLEAGRVVAAVPGVSGVPNDLMAMRASDRGKYFSTAAAAALKDINEAAS